MLLAAYFRLEYLEEVSELHRNQYFVKAKTTLGVKYDINNQRGSGSPETALFNTILAKFCDYLARRLRSDEPCKAFSAKGQFGGDDSISPDIETSHLVKASAMVGQNVENVEFYRGEPGVNYLSRFYGKAVWYGSCDSTCDLPRALGKLHVTPNLGQFTPLVKLQQKLLGLYYTDRNTPILSEIMTAADRLGMDWHCKSEPLLENWWTKYELLVNWPNDFVDDEAELLDRMLGKYDLTALKNYLIHCTDIKQLLTMPLITNPEDISVKVGTTTKYTVVDDTIHLRLKSTTLPLEIKDREQKIEQAAAPASTEKQADICWHYIDGKCKAKPCKFQHTKVCKFYLDGSCKSDKCKFLHVKRK